MPVRRNLVETAAEDFRPPVFKPNISARSRLENRAHRFFDLQFGSAWTGFAPCARARQPARHWLWRAGLSQPTLRTVRRCPCDADVVLLLAGTTVALLREARLDSPSVRFFPFLPLNGKLARLIDQGLAWLPLCAQYIASATVSG
jgi:hypothetical protein